jgi:hypothetical protein
MAAISFLVQLCRRLVAATASRRIRRAFLCWSASRSDASSGCSEGRGGEAGGGGGVDGSGLILRSSMTVDMRARRKVARGRTSLAAAVTTLGEGFIS